MSNFLLTCKNHHNLLLLQLVEASVNVGPSPLDGAKFEEGRFLIIIAFPPAAVISPLSQFLSLLLLT